jgi:ferrous iron transport protein B
MNLSELKDGNKAVITKIHGEGAFRQRIIEMGFIVGQEIEAIKRAPLLDPAEYCIMGYNVSLRKSEAEMIEIDSDFSETIAEGLNVYSVDSVSDLNEKRSDNKVIRIALVGNPNCGKTTIFNFASNSHERVGNYTGVTVSAKEATATVGKHKINIVDLPGTYSLSSFSPEELYVIDYLTSQKPDIIVNVIDGSNLERNLYLTTQLLDLGFNIIVALNMYDEMKLNGDTLDHEKLQQLLGIKVIPTIGTKGQGIEELFNSIEDIYEGNIQTNNRSLRFNPEIEAEIDKIIALLDNSTFNSFMPGITSRFIALKLIEKDKFITEKTQSLPIGAQVIGLSARVVEIIKKQLDKDSTGAIADARYGFISGALQETYKQGSRKNQEISKKADKLLTGKLLGLPVFFGLIWLTFYATFTVGAYPVGWIESLLELLSKGANAILPSGIWHDLVIDGIIGGVGGVIVFLPSIMILFLFISLMEDTGYMARTAFLMDKAMHKMGLHGKSFIPLLMGFGCNVPAVMATRTIESKRDRILTMMAIPFMSCSARLPVYVLFISAFFPVYRGSILFAVYLIGILAAFFTALIFNRTIFKKAESPFVMELPPYRIPTLKSVLKHMWFKSFYFLKKMGTIILLASVIIWVLGYFPRDHKTEKMYDDKISQTTQNYEIKIQNTRDESLKTTLTNQRDEEISTIELSKNSAHLEQSYISRIGKTISPVFAPLGFDWKMSVSILTGVLAKEIVVSSMGVLYHADSDADENSVSLIKKLQRSQQTSNIPVYVYFGFLVFILLYFPCIGTLAAIRKETGNIKWMLFETVYTTGLAWLVAFVIFIVGGLIH